ncbi:ABC transporter substrate-binding protein [Desulfocastanea catecholica]
MKARYIPLFLLFFWPFFLSSSHSAELIEGYSPEEALRLGERMYRDGILPSGEPMQAMVMGDIPFDGRMFTCDDCHQRSGLGSKEGTVITWPTNGRELYSPRRSTGAFRQPASEAEKKNFRRKLPQYFQQIEDVRPAYTDKTLARVLRVGKDPADRKLDPIMPKYRLSNKNMAILVYYLKNLSVELSPGVDETFLQFATVIASDVAEEKKTAMLSVLQAHIDAHNSQTRHEDRRAASGPFYKSERHQAYRKLQLHVWELTGPETTWPEQLEKYYASQPVFALLGGITGGSWEKIHAFSKQYKVPCIFPVTDLPVISDSDWYTLYFAKGYYQEGESTAKYVRAEMGLDKQLKIVQVYRQGDGRGSALARGFAETWRKMGGTGLEDLLLRENSLDRDRIFSELFTGDKPVVLLVWLDESDTDTFKNLSSHAGRAAMMFTSSSLLHHDFSIISDQLRENLLVTYPYSLPQEDERSRFAVERWLQARKIPVVDFDIQAKMYFLGWMLPGAIKSMRHEFFRDKFLEGFDMMIDQDYAIAVYPRLTFGPGQRYASKGCYIVKLTKGENPELVPTSDWVTY